MLLVEIGVVYLSLSWCTEWLSGRESQRVKIGGSLAVIKLHLDFRPLFCWWKYRRVRKSKENLDLFSLCFISRFLRKEYITKRSPSLAWGLKDSVEFRGKSRCHQSDSMGRLTSSQRPSFSLEFTSLFLSLTNIRFSDSKVFLDQLPNEHLGRRPEYSCPDGDQVQAY